MSQKSAAQDGLAVAKSYTRIPHPREAEIIQDYTQTAITITDLCLKYGMSRQAFITLRSHHDLTKRRRRQPVSRTGLIERLFKVLDRQIKQLETDMTQTGDKEVALLGNMARTLEKLIDLDKAERPAKAGKGQSKDMSALRNKLAQRIDQLKKS